jgi:hypothetical protein
VAFGAAGASFGDGSGVAAAVVRDLMPFVGPFDRPLSVGGRRHDRPPMLADRMPTAWSASGACLAGRPVVNPVRLIHPAHVDGG